MWRSSWLFLTPSEPEFNKYLPSQVTVVSTNLVLSRPRFPAARWSKRGLTTLLIPRRDPPSDITIFMDINPNAGPSFAQEDGLNHSRLAETHLHVTSKSGQTLGNLRTTTTSLSTTTGSELQCTAQARPVNFVVVVSSTTPNKVESRRPAIHKLRQV